MVCYMWFLGPLILFNIGDGTKSLLKERNDQYIIIEGDIKVTPREYLYHQLSPGGVQQFVEVELPYIPVVERHTGRKTRYKRAVTGIPERLWPNATIPFVVNINITDNVKLNIKRAINHWEEKTCIRFVNRTVEENYVEFAPGACGCCSFVGQQMGRQTVSLSSRCAQYGVVIHEIGHVIGFWHEHSRPDRDKYIKVMKENVKKAKMDNFNKKADHEIDSLGQPYDYYSIMHYTKTTFSVNGENTMTPTKDGVSIGQRTSLSPGDIIQTILLYKCPKPDCNHTYTGTHGLFKSPNYPAKYFTGDKCTWTIIQQPGRYIVLEFIDFNLENSKNCTFDYIEIRQGLEAPGELIGRLCGQGKPGIIHSETTLWLHFVSDKSVAARGFLAQYKLVEKISNLDDEGSGDDDGLGSSLQFSAYAPYCKDIMLSAPFGKIQSPLSPVLYPDEFECSWTINGGDNAKHIQLDFSLKHVKKLTDSCVAKILIPNTEADEMANGSGEIHFQERFSQVDYNCLEARTLVVNASSVTVLWLSRTHEPLKLSYTVDYDECELKQDDCQQVCNNLIKGYACQCHPGYTLHDNGFTCLPKILEFTDTCGSAVSSLRGKIRSSTEPQRNCIWNILLHHEHSIVLTFVKFNVPSDANCTKNYVEVYGKTVRNTLLCTCTPSNYLFILPPPEVFTNNAGDIEFKGRFCDDKLPSVITASSGVMKVKMHSDLSSSGGRLPYFSAQYFGHKKKSRSSCVFKLSGSSNGNITSLGYPTPYEPHTMCIWKYYAPKRRKILLKFHDFDIESTKNCYFDSLEIRDGRYRTSPLIIRLCGTEVPNDIITSGRYVLIRFISDGSNSGRGFHLEYKPVS